MERTITVRVEVDENEEAIEIAKEIEDLLRNRAKRVDSSIYMYEMPAFYEGGSEK